MTDTLETKIKKVVESHVGYLELENARLRNENFKLRITLERIINDLQHTSIVANNVLQNNPEVKSLTHTKDITNDICME